MDKLTSEKIDQLFLFLEDVRKLHNEKKILDSDYVALYILACLSKVKVIFIAGRITPPIIEDLEDETHPLILFEAFPSLYDKFNSSKKQWINKETTIFQIFNQLRFVSIPNYVNTAMVHWMRHKRPLILLFSIPSPLKVLRMQSEGDRVISMLREINELSSLHSSPLTYMDEQPLHARDAVNFLMHDLKHIELFVREDIYFEQVGFFHKFKKINNGKIKEFFTNQGLSVTFWPKIEYVISDMNTYSLHLLKYLKAKWMMEKDVHFEEGFNNFLNELGIEKESEIRLTCERFCFEDG